MIIRGVLAISARLRLDEIEKYLKTTEKYLKKAEADFRIWFEEKIKNIPPEEQEEFGEVYSEEYWEYAETFPRVLRNSFFITAYSLLEYEMTVICRWLKRDKQLSISMSDLRGDTLEQFKLYCKVAHLVIPHDNQIWQEIKHYSKVRNCIVHYNGLIKEFPSDQSFMRYITNKNIVSRETIQQQIALTEQFCRDVLKTIWTFLSKVYEAYGLQKAVT